MTSAGNQQERLSRDESAKWFLAGFMDRKEHLTPDGLVRVIEMAYTMNPNSKGRERLRTLSELRERILRGHTSDIPLVRG